MSRIARIARLRKFGVFRDFSWPSDLPEFGRYNLIYGWNGTGKTTISRLLRALEQRRQPESGLVSLVIDGSEVRAEDFQRSTLPIRVFNRDFIEESVFRRDGGELRPIFVFGKDSVEKQKEVDRLKNQRSTAQAKLQDARKSKQEAERNFDRFCIDRARNIKETLRSSGENPYNNYDKSDFRRVAANMAEDGDGSTYRLSDHERERLFAQCRASRKTKVQEVTYALPDLSEIARAVSELLRTTVAARAIEALKRDPALAEWMRQGLRLHHERGSEQCLFCAQPMPKDRLDALEAHFSNQYEQFIQSLDQLIADLRAKAATADGLRLPNKAELYEDLAAEFEVATASINVTLQEVRSFLEKAIEVLVEKKHRPFEKAEPTLHPPELDPEVIKKLNEVIRRHNQACDEFDKRVAEARKKLAEDMIAEVLGDFVSLREIVRKADEDVGAAQKEVQQLNEEIERLEREIVEHRRPAEELNEDLRKYLGHDELRVQVQDTGYVITRGGVLAQALSEGEMTAIALLYFLKSLEGREFPLSDGIVVLDDPVSSLDANALYLAFGFIRERTKKAGQLIILTHNFGFFRQVRNWFHHVNGKRKKEISQQPARFYMLDCKQDQNGRFTTIRQLDPLLKDYESEYHYLFARVYKAATETGPKGLEENYVLPNIGRRLLEAFLAFRCPDVAGELWRKVEAMTFDEAKKLRILRFVHTYSHSEAVGEPEHDPSLLAESGAVLQDLLDFIKAQDKEHFNAVERLVKPQAAANDE
jgi:wobble nucleotide-excising tRNase